MRGYKNYLRPPYSRMKFHFFYFWKWAWFLWISSSSSIFCKIISVNYNSFSRSLTHSLSGGAHWCVTFNWSNAVIVDDIFCGSHQMTNCFGWLVTLVHTYISKLLLLAYFVTFRLSTVTSRSIKHHVLHTLSVVVMVMMMIVVPKNVRIDSIFTTIYKFPGGYMLKRKKLIERKRVELNCLAHLDYKLYFSFKLSRT